MKPGRKIDAVAPQVAGILQVGHEGAHGDKNHEDVRGDNQNEYPTAKGGEFLSHQGASGLNQLQSLCPKAPSL